MYKCLQNGKNSTKFRLKFAVNSVTITENF